MVQFLGMSVYKTASGFAIGQQPYLEDLMKKYDVQVTSRQTVPRDWVKDEPEQREYTSGELRKAQSIVGELLWVAQRSRPDISHTVSLLAAWSSKDPALVLQLGIKVLQYLRGSFTQRLYLQASTSPEVPDLECFTDASFAPYGSRSYSGICVRYKGCLVLWRATKQTLVTLSSSEAELVSVTEGVVLSVGVRELLTQMLGVQLPVHLRVDNTAALQLIEGKGANRTRHLRIRSSFVREKVEQGELLPSHVPGERQLADLLTKVLPGPRLQLLRSMLGMRDREQRIPIDTIQGGEPPDNNRVQSVTCTDALQRCLLFLVACLQVQSAEGQDDEVQRLEVDPPYELMLLTALVVLSVLALWEGGRSLVQCCVTRSTPRVRAVAKGSKGQEC